MPFQLFPPVKVGDETRVAIPFFNQNDNASWDGVDGNVQCCPTNNALFAFHHSPKFRNDFIASGLKEPEDYYKQQFELAGFSAGDRGDHTCHSATLNRLGILSDWTTSGTDAQIKEAIDNGSSLVAGFNYKTAGHITQIVGYYPGGYLVHDCYGQRNGASDSYGFINPREGVPRGAYDKYSYDVLQLVLFDQVKAGAWVRFFRGLK